MFPFPSQILQGGSYIFLHFFIPSIDSWHMLWHSLGFPKIKAYGNALCAFYWKIRFHEARGKGILGHQKEKRICYRAGYYLLSNVNDWLILQDSLLGGHLNDSF